MRFFYSTGGALMCDEQRLRSWQPESRGDFYFPDPEPLGVETLYFVAESMDKETARLIAEALGGELEEYK